MLLTTRNTGETGPLTDVAPGAEAWRKEKRPEKKDFSMCRRRSDPAVQIGEVSCAVHENGRCEGVEARWPRSDQLELQRGPLATAPTPMKKLLSRITKELAKGKAPKPCRFGRSRGKSGSWCSVHATPDIQETTRPIVTEADLNNSLLQTTSLKELLAIMRENRQRQSCQQ